MSDWRPATTGLLCALLCSFGPVTSRGQETPMVSRLTTREREQLQREARQVVDLVQNLHYSGKTFHEVKNEEILTQFLAELDPDGSFFSTDDLAFVHQRFDRSLKSVYLFRGDLEPAFEIFDLYTGLVRERLAWIDQRLNSPFDFAVDETFTEIRRGDPAPAKPVSPDQRWELRLKDEMLHETLSGRTDDEARAHLRTSYAEFGRSLGTFDSFVVRERFLDTAIRSFDPHSGYSSAESTREFSVRMKGLVTGIGIVLGKEHGRSVVAAVYPGSPADLHSALAPGDRLEALAQGDGPWVDVRQQRLRDTVDAMRTGNNGNLRVAYSPAGSNERKEITLERAEVVIAADRAWGAISSVPAADGKTRSIGWIVLPAFYGDGEHADGVSGARDVRILLDQMKSAPLDGLVLDLRGNPGGSLNEAVALSQLFLPGGTVMLSRGANRAVKTHTLKNEPPPYPGPLVVLASATSASSSEIFTGTMKYHHRALVVGATSTFGKGTVQNYLDLAKIQGLTGDAVKDWGTLRLTTERFFLPDGTGIQRRGVASDVILPEFDPPGIEREANMPHALAVEDIAASPAPGSPAAPALAETLRGALVQAAADDLQTSPDWKVWSEERKLYRELADRRTRSLKKDVRSEAWEVALGGMKAVRDRRRELAATAAFVTRPLEIPVVAAARDAHQAKLRALGGAEGKLPLHRLSHGTFLVQTDLGRLRDISLQDIDFISLLADADTMAAAFSAGCGQTVSAASTRSLLEQLALLEHKTDEAVNAAAAKVVPATVDGPAIQRGIESLLLRITELQPEFRQERQALDVPLRESLRLAAKWAELNAAPAAVTR